MWLSRMRCSDLWLLALLVLFAGLASGSSLAPVCPLPSLGELLLPVEEQCPKVSGNSVPLRVWASSESRVLELGEGSLEQALKIVRWNNETFVAVLYYASWCQFSKQLRPVFHTLSMMFPSVFHLEVEEASIRPGLLSKFGVHSFPVLYIHSGTSRTRYSGPRTIEDLTKFYLNTTGLQPAKLMNVPDFKVPTVEPSLSERLQSDTYLVLASWFLILRLLALVLPNAVTRVKNFWDRCHLYRMLMPRGQNELHGQGAVERRPSLKHKRRLSVPGWSHHIAAPASSLAIAESSARRITSSEELRR